MTSFFQRNRSNPSTTAPRRRCFGEDFDSQSHECVEQCPWRNSCAEKCGRGTTRVPVRSTGLSRGKASTPSNKPAAQVGHAKRFSEVFEVDAPEGTTLGQAFARNASLSAAGEVIDELGEMVRSIPFWAYDTIVNPRKRKKKD